MCSEAHQTPSSYFFFKIWLHNSAAVQIIKLMVRGSCGHWTVDYVNYIMMNMF